MELKPGYKQTEVGVIPEDWLIQPLRDLTIMMTNGFVGTATRHYTHKDSAILYIQGYNVEENSFNFNGIKYVTEDFHKQHLKSCLREGDLLTVQTGDVGLTTIVPKELSGANCHALIISRIHRKRAVPKYVSFYLNSTLGRSRLKLIEIGTTMKHLNVGDMLNFEVPAPSSLLEQQAIADALSDADALIESLEQLLTKKRQIKQGAMQELLTGQRRLPGFCGRWEETALGTLGEFLKGSGVTRDQAQSGSLACVRYGEIYTAHNDYIRTFYSWISSEVAVSAIRLKKGDLLFAGSGETKGEIGKCVAFLEGIEAYAGGDIVILRPRSGDPLFFGYLLNTDNVIRQKSSRGQGDAVVHISATALASVTVNIPDMDEQSAIASVLSAMDNEITSLETQLQKAGLIKQGMMQELLTGRIRLV